MPRMLISLVVAALFLLPSGAMAETLSKKEQAINAVISAQLDAFRHHDAAAAFSLAAPDIQARFQSAENFIAAVATQYLPLYSSKRVEFLGLAEEGTDAIQRLKVLGSDGKEYIAYYPMELQPDGSWKIGGCHVEPIAGLDT